MASETKRQNVGSKVPVALPKGEPSQPASSLVSQDVSLQLSIGAFIRVSTAAPNQPSVEGTVYTVDPLTNLLVLNVSPTNKTTIISSTSLAAPKGSYRIIPLSQITSFQILSLPSVTTSPNPSTSAEENTLDTAALQARLNRSIATAQSALARQGPKGTSTTDQALFDALSRTHPARWTGTSMLISDTYIIEKPYHAANVKFVQGRHGDLERMKKVVDMEKNKVALRMGKGLIDGRMSGDRDGKGFSATTPAANTVAAVAGGMKKGG